MPVVLDLSLSLIRFLIMDNLMCDENDVISIIGEPRQGLVSASKDQLKLAEDLLHDSEYLDVCNMTTNINVYASDIVVGSSRGVDDE